MTTRMGAVRAWHFAHRIPTPGEPPCAPETYRHILAKNVFRLKFKQARREERPFEVEMFHPICCVRHQDFPNCTIDFGGELRRWDLTRHYDDVLLEERFESYIPDLRLVHSAHPNRSLSVGIKVTHAATERKRADLKMIEIDAQDESIVDAFDDFCLQHGQFTAEHIIPPPIFRSVPCICAEVAEQERIAKEEEAERERTARSEAEDKRRREKSWVREERRAIKIAQRDSIAVSEEGMRRYEFRNHGEPQTGNGTWRILRSPAKRKRVTLAEIIGQLDFNSEMLWYDHERGIAIRRLRGQWHPYSVQTPDGEHGFPRLEEALLKFIKLANQLDDGR